MRTLAIITVLLLGSLSSFASITSMDHLLDTFTIGNRSQKSSIDFAGLNFKIDPSTTTCKKAADDVNCEMVITEKKGQRARADIHLARKKLHHPSALGLMRMKRKEDWAMRYPSRNQMIEEDYKVGIFQTRMQQYKYYRLDNTFWPVLIRASDIAVDDKTVISVTITCDAVDWPMIKKEMESIELSFTRTTRK